MTTFLNKIRTLTVGTAHDLLDKAIDMNSPTMVRQYVRDLEEALNKLNLEVANEDGQIRTATRLKSDLERKIAADQAVIAKLIESGKKDLARSKATVTVQDQKQVTAYTETIESQSAALEKLKITVSNIEQKHTLMVNQVRELERLDKESKAKESAANAISRAASLVNAGADISVDDVAAKIKARHDQADARFDQAMGSIPTSDENTDEVDALLNSLTPTHQ